MKQKIVEQAEAVRLRKAGLTYPAIRRVLRVSSSSLSRWLHMIPVTIDRKMVMPSEIFRTQGARLHTERLDRTTAVIELAQNEIGPLSIRELKIVGAALYWAEGTRGSDREIIDFANSDPEMVRLALRWLRITCGVPDQKIRVQLHVHTDLNLEECLQFWIEVTELPREQFTKPQIKNSSLGYRKKRLYRGTVQIRVHDKQLYRRIQGWIQGLRSDRSAPVAQSE